MKLMFLVVYITLVLSNNDVKSSLNKLLAFNTEVGERLKVPWRAQKRLCFTRRLCKQSIFWCVVPQHTEGLVSHSPFFTTWWRDTLKSHSCQQSFFF